MDMINQRDHLLIPELPARARVKEKVRSLRSDKEVIEEINVPTLLVGSNFGFRHRPGMGSLNGPSNILHSEVVIKLG